MIEESNFKDIIFEDVARKQLLKGVDTLANAVKVTMGPCGQNVVIEKANGPPHLTKDGVTVAKAINLRDKFLNLGAQILKEAASRTGDMAGDGTTTATVLAQSIYSEGLKMIAAGYQGAEILAGIKMGTDYVLEQLQDMAVPVKNEEDIINVGTISANGDRNIGELLAQAMGEVGKDGIITVEEAKGFKTDLNILEGFEIDRGFCSPYFVTHAEKNMANLENAYILLYNKKVETLNEILPVLEAVHESGRSLVIIADDYDNEVLHGLVLNRVKGNLHVAATRAPEFGEARVNAMEDLALVFGTKVFNQMNKDDLKHTGLEDLGRCRRVMLFKNKTIFIGTKGNAEDIQARCTEIKKNLHDSNLEFLDREVFARRHRRLVGGVAVLRVGAATETELRETRDRVDDALHATQAAVQEGILPGGGAALAKASMRLDKHLRNYKVDGLRVGAEIVRNAVRTPLTQIIKNAGGSAEIILEKTLKGRGNLGYNAASDQWVDLLEDGVIDPLKVVKAALENASSAARMLLSVGCAMVDDESKWDESENNLKI